MQRNRMITALIAAGLGIMLMTYAAPMQSGGSFTIEKSVIANGGGSSSVITNVFLIEGTVGQNIAGTQSTSGEFSVHGGFWTPASFAPTAATVRVRGRVERSSGIGMGNAVLILTDVSTGSARMARTSPFGYFSFDDVPVGAFYILTVSHRSYTFVPNSYGFNLMEEPPEIIFRANE